MCRLQVGIFIGSFSESNVKNEKHFAHYDAETGAILGLYNSRRHPIIPNPSVSITEQQRTQIVKRPTEYSVNVEREELEHRPRVIRAPSEGFVAQREYEERIGSGVQVNDTFYCADDEASAHLTQCLALHLAGVQDEFQVKCVEEGQIVMVSVGDETLKEVASAVNQVRADAKSELLSAQMIERTMVQR